MYKIFFYHLTVAIKTCKKAVGSLKASKVLEIIFKYVLITDIKKRN